MQLFSFDGLVLRSGQCGENDKILTILTAEHGKLTVLAKGAKKVGSKFFSCSSSFVYATFTVGKTRDMLYLRESEIIRSFYRLSQNDLSGYALLSYISQVCEDVSTSEGEQELLSLALNAMHLIQTNEKPNKLIKAVFELRCAVICGFSPDVSGCRICGGSSKDLYLEIMNGTVICSECKTSSQPVNKDIDINGERILIVPLSTSSLCAFQHIVYSEPKKIFSFNIVGNDAVLLYSACEKYLLNHLERTFSTLDYFYSIPDDTDRI